MYLQVAKQGSFLNQQRISPFNLHPASRDVVMNIWNIHLSNAPRLNGLKNLACDLRPFVWPSILPEPHFYSSLVLLLQAVLDETDAFCRTFHLPVSLAQE